MTTLCLLGLAHKDFYWLWVLFTFHIWCTKLHPTLSPYCFGSWARRFEYNSCCYRGCDTFNLISNSGTTFVHYLISPNDGFCFMFDCSKYVSKFLSLEVFQMSNRTLVRELCWSQCWNLQSQPWGDIFHLLCFWSCLLNSSGLGRKCMSERTFLSF